MPGNSETAPLLGNSGGWWQVSPGVTGLVGVVNGSPFGVEKDVSASRSD